MRHVRAVALLEEEKKKKKKRVCMLYMSVASNTIVSMKRKLRRRDTVDYLKLKIKITDKRIV